MRHAFKKILSLAIMSVGIIGLGISSAEDVQKPMYMTDWEYIGNQGQIKEVSAQGDYIVVSGVKVLVVKDFVYEGKRYMTSIKNLKGKNDALSVGEWVFVWGPGLRGDRIMAKDIYILSGALNDKDLRKYVQSSEKWDYQAVETFAKKK